jgi:hypothetical protein
MGTVLLTWNVAEGTVANRVVLSAAAVSVRVDREGRRALIGTAGGRVELWTLSASPPR